MKFNLLKKKEWEKSISKEIINYLIKLNKKKINLIFTGGKSVERIYGEFFKNIKKTKNFFFRIYLSDERCRVKSLKDMNSTIIKKNIGTSKNTKVKFFPIVPSLKENDFEMCTKRYNKIIPKDISFAIFSVARDGHIASIFENDEIANFSKNKYVFVDKKFKKFPRISITWNQIKLIKKILLICKNKEREKALKKFSMKKNHILKKISSLGPKVEVSVLRNNF
tara:strand:- start:941 stop:1609 length:669 start_codon:yes stop_codon:yes gene_type:complete